jgi:hypothetical protein
MKKTLTPPDINQALAKSRALGMLCVSAIAKMESSSVILGIRLSLH